jgi:IS5 family transposase
MIDGIKIEILEKPKKGTGAYEKRKARKRFRRRTGIEPILGQLNSDFRLLWDYSKGSMGDSINLMLAAAAYNSKRLMTPLPDYLLFFFHVINPTGNHSMSLAIASQGWIPCFSGSTTLL